MSIPIDRTGALFFGWDAYLFHAIHPSTEPSSAMLLLARVLAVVPLLLAGCVAMWMVLGKDRALRSIALLAGVATIAALAVNGVIALLWNRPRPFVAGVGHAWMQHAATGSFPSDHLTAQWALADVLLLHRQARVWGIAIAVAGLPMAWARIYLGVHYPGDMVGALVVGLLAMGAARWSMSWRRALPATSPSIPPGKRR